MRLICPNCGAQYDVPDGSIPPAGREVQCSGCSHAWFEIKAPDTDTAPAIPVPDIPEPDTHEPATEAPPAPPSSTVPPRRPIDESVKAILREEAARDSNLPAAAPEPDAAAPEPEPAEQTKTSPPETAASTTTAAPVPMIVPPPAAMPASSRSDMPSMDDINARLRARSQSPQTLDHEDIATIERRGFRRGFALMLLFIALLLTPYVFAAQIGAAVPQLQDGLTSYVAMIDQIRLRLNGALKPLLDQIAAAIGSS